MLLVPEEEALGEEYNIFETLQAQTERIELLEEQNAALIRQEKLLLEILELSKKTEQEVTESLSELRMFFANREALSKSNSSQQ